MFFQVDDIWVPQLSNMKNVFSLLTRISLLTLRNVTIPAEYGIFIIFSHKKLGGNHTSGRGIKNNQVTKNLRK